MLDLIVQSIFVFTILSKFTGAQICAPNPCQNNGLCVPVDATVFYCVCSSDFKGSLCETPSQCNCLNGGTCRVNGNTFTCTCPAEFSGASCQLVNPCFINPCQNNAVCSISPINDPVCTCLPGFTGNLCQVKFNPPCGSENCQNGGTCLSETSFFGTVTQFCKCPANYFGQFCQVTLTRQLCDSADTNVIYCSFWNLLGLCGYDYIYGYLPIPYYCPSTCKLCKDLATCRDSQASCKLWAALKLCSVIPDQNLCKESCGLCVPGIFKR